MDDKLKEINKLKERLVEKVRNRSNNLLDKEVQKLSKKIDKLLLEYMKKR